MPNSDEPVTLVSLSNGAALELFDEELSKVIADILDPNTEAVTVREINLKLRIKPNEDRRRGVVGLQVTSKLGPQKGVGTEFFFGKRAGRCVAVESNPDQLSFDKKWGVVNMNTETGEVSGDQ